MSLWIDQKYVALVGQSLSRFRRISPTLWVCRCKICGDSQKSKTKSRFYFYTANQKVLVQCKNCDYSTTLSKFLESQSPSLYAEYRRELYLEKHENREPKKITEDEPELIVPDIPDRFKKPKQKSKSVPFDGKLKSIADLPADHGAVKYISDRKIPERAWDKMFFIEHICDITKFPGFEKYEERVNGKEPRIVLPFYNIDGMMTGITARVIRGESFRYIALKLDEDEPMIFGVNGIDFDKDIYVTEGPFDSLFIENCIAVGGTGMAKLESLGIDKDKMVIIFDNQRKQRDVVNIIEKTIKKGYRVLIWGDKIRSKDINEMVLNKENYIDQIENNVYSGNLAKVKFNLWRKV